MVYISLIRGCLSCSGLKYLQIPYSTHFINVLSSPPSSTTMQAEGPPTIGYEVDKTGAVFAIGTIVASACVLLPIVFITFSPSLFSLTRLDCGELAQLNATGKHYHQISSTVSPELILSRYYNLYTNGSDTLALRLFVSYWFGLTEYIIQPESMLGGICLVGPE